MGSFADIVFWLSAISAHLSLVTLLWMQGVSTWLLVPLSLFGSTIFGLIMCQCLHYFPRLGEAVSRDRNQSGAGGNCAIAITYFLTALVATPLALPLLEARQRNLFGPGHLPVAPWLLALPVALAAAMAVALVWIWCRTRFCA